MEPFKVTALASKNVEELADWLELNSLITDNSASIMDLTRNLQRSSTPIELVDEESVSGNNFHDNATLSQFKSEDAFGDIADRSQFFILNTLKDLYPFKVEDRSIRFQSSIHKKNPAYLTLLLLSYLGHDSTDDKTEGSKLFEDLSAFAAYSFFGKGNLLNYTVFGFPRRLQPEGFKDALNALCLETGMEGTAKDHPRQKDQKDAGLDIVLWANFNDHRPGGKFLAFGQCATGIHWRKKTLTLSRPDGWTKKWMQTPPLEDIYRLFFVPHKLNLGDMEHATIDAGLTMDRCRIASLSKALPVDLKKRCANWCVDAIANLKKFGTVEKPKKSKRKVLKKKKIKSNKKKK